MSKKINKKDYRLVWVNGSLQIIKRFHGQYELWIYKGKDELGFPCYQWIASSDEKQDLINKFDLVP